MPSLATWLKFLHVALAFGFVAGLIGRDLVLRAAARASAISSVSALVGVAGRFEKLMVIPGSAAVLPAGLLTMWAEHRPFFAHGSYWLPVSLFVYLALLVLVPTVFIPRGKVFDSHLTAARERGVVTPELTHAFSDRAVWAARTTETLGVAFILALMVLCPSDSSGSRGTLRPQKRGE